MPATYLGLPASSGRLLRSTIHRREPVGLETIHDIYTIRSADAPGIIPAYDSAHPTYGNMALEEAEITPAEGGLAEMSLKYVGLTGSAPRPTLRALPSDNSLTYFNPYLIEISFVDLLSSLQTVIASTKTLTSPFFRGITLPGEFRAPFRMDEASEENSLAEYYKTVGWSSSSLGNSAFTGPTIEEKSVRTVIDYEGVRRLSMTYQKRGLHAIYTMTFGEQYRVITINPAT